MRVAIYTLGCKVNQFESFAIMDQYKELGCEIVSWNEKADIYVVNTCAVTSKAAYQSRQILRRLKIKHPDSKIIATGCHVQTDPGKVLESVGSGICLAGNQLKERIAPMSLENRDKDCTGIFVSDITRAKCISRLSLQGMPEDRTRAFVRIQDGCNAFCSYCIVPYARGPSRSLDEKGVFKQVEVLVSKGVKEIVLTGIHIGHYGLDLSPKTNLLYLLLGLCNKFAAVRFRLSSIEPTELSLEMARKLLEVPNFCPHFHIPLQSGSDRVLSHMNRKYKASLFKELVLGIKELSPYCAIGTDVMAGFPTETPEDFQKTIDLLQGLPISYLHAFPYSKRPGTVASMLKGSCNTKEGKKRAKILIKLGNEKKEAFYNSLIGRKLQVLFERQVSANTNFRVFEGHSENYALVRVESQKDIANSIHEIEPFKLIKEMPPYLAVRNRLLM